MKTITKIFIALVLGVVFTLGAFPNIAHAEETEVQTDIADFDYYLTGTWQYNQQSGSFTGYDMVKRSDGYFSMSRIGTLDANHSQYNDAYLVMNTSQVWKMPLTTNQFEGGNYSVPSLSVNTCDFVINYDLPALDGWYTLQYDIFVGVTCNYNSYSNAVLTNTLTSDGAADFYTDANGHTFIVQYLDNDIRVSTTYSTACVSDMLHFRVVYEGDQNDTSLEFHLGDYISNHIAGWRAGGLNGGRYNTESWYMIQSFFLPTLYYELEPPATPTPIPTPYPGQDTQESINAGVQQIVQGLDVQATPIPHPDDLTIDETIFDALDDMTLPDVTPAQSTFTNLWSIFNPLWAFVGLFAGSMTLVGIFMYCLKGRFI